MNTCGSRDEIEIRVLSMSNWFLKPVNGTVVQYSVQIKKCWIQ